MTELMRYQLMGFHKIIEVEIPNSPRFPCGCLFYCIRCGRRSIPISDRAHCRLAVESRDECYPSPNLEERIRIAADIEVLLKEAQESGAACAGCPNYAEHVYLHMWTWERIRTSGPVKTD